jgi:hypothetical protein
MIMTKNGTQLNETKWLLEFIGRSKSKFNANGIWRQDYELSIQLQDLHIDVALLSDTHLKSHERYFILNYHVYWTDRIPGRKGGIVIAISKDIPHNHAELPPLVSIEATGVCIPIGNSELPLAAIYKSPGHAWNDEDVSEISRVKHKSLLAEDLNAQHPFWNSVVSNPSGAKIMNLLHINEHEISAHVPLITLLREMVTCSVLLCTRCQTVRNHYL